LIIVAGGYVYINFFQEDEADEVCCAKHELTPPKVLTITESTPIPILDSSKANQQITYNILNQVQEGLMRLGPNDIPVPGLAESYQVSPDQRTYTFTIRKNAVWSDGKAVTAHDFKFAWERALSPANEYAFAYLFYPINNAEAYSLGKVKSDQVGITATDNRHLTIQLDKPDPNFLSLVTITAFLPLRQDLVEKYGEYFGTSAETMSFTGPFKLKAFTPEKALLEKNMSYWDQGKVNLKEAIINVEVDIDKSIQNYKSELTSLINVDSPKKISKNNYGEFKKNPKAITDFLVFNHKSNFFANSNIRKSILLAINKKSIVMSNGPTDAKDFIPPVIKSNKEVFRSGIDVSNQVNRAKEFLELGIKEVGLKENKLLTIVTYNDKPSIDLANQVKKILHDELGLNTVVRSYDSKRKKQVELSGDFDLSIFEWSAKYHEPLNFLTFMKSNETTNTSGFNSSHYDALLSQAEMQSDGVKRTKLLNDAEKYLIMDQIALVPLIHINSYHLEKKYVKNILFHPFRTEYTLKWATYQPPKKVEATK
jgi:oligopeptide transport system substrate-binding protein